MVVAIMQPYFFPYVGYFQLIALADIFVFLDDVQHIKHGWVNRNRILQNGGPSWITLPVNRAPHELAINQRHYQLSSGIVGRLLRRIESNYKRSPHFAETFRLITTIMAFDDANVAAFNIQLIERISEHLELKKRFVRSSALIPQNKRTGEDRVIDLCRRLDATNYVNPIGGKALYSREHFSDAGIRLKFLESAAPSYAQFGNTPVPSLSIIDTLMFVETREISKMLDAYRLS